MRDKKWPIVPHPLPLECLSSWLHRIGKQYGLTAAQLVNSLLRDDYPERRISFVETLDSFTHPIILGLLSCATGLPERRIRRMTLAHYVPHLAEHEGEPLFRRFTFAQYIGRFTVTPPQFLPEAPEPLIPWDRLTVANDMPVCMTCLQREERLHTKITWRFNVVASCPWHGRQVQPMRAFTRNLEEWDYFADPKRFTAHPYQQLLDAITNHVFHYGGSDLPNGISISPQWWMRALRGMAEEVLRMAILDDHGIGIPRVFSEVFEKVGKPSKHLLSLHKPLEEMSPGYSAEIWVCVGALIHKLGNGELEPYAGSRLAALVAFQSNEAAA